jgi:DNA-binding transcriptional regulator YiaG
LPSSVYPRLKLNQSERDEYVAHLIDQLRDLERKTDPKDGAQSAKGKDVAARDALKIAGDLVNSLAGWALDHQAGLALKDDAFMQFSTVKTPEHPYGSNIKSTDDDHRVEWAGRNWSGRDGVPINPILARKWLMHLVRAFTGIFNLELRLMTLAALEACDYGETQPMLMATKKDRKVNWTILQLQLKAITFVKYREALGMKKFKALEDVAGAFGVSVNTVRSWEPRLRTEFGPIEITNRLAAAEEAGKNERDAEHRASSISLSGRQDLKEFARQYKMARRRAKRAPQK